MSFRVTRLTTLTREGRIALLTKMLKASKGNVQKVAFQLGVNRSALSRTISGLGMKAEDFRPVKR